MLSDTTSSSVPGTVSHIRACTHTHSGSLSHTHTHLLSHTDIVYLLLTPCLSRSLSYSLCNDFEEPCFAKHKANSNLSKDCKPHKINTQANYSVRHVHTCITEYRLINYYHSDLQYSTLKGTFLHSCSAVHTLHLII